MVKIVNIANKIWYCISKIYYSKMVILKKLNCNANKINKISKNENKQQKI